MQPLEFLSFAFGCECGQRIIVKPDQRHQQVKCLACGRLHGPVGDMPTLQSLPGKDASLKELIRFADTYNPTPHFRKSWGENYESNIGTLRTSCVQAFKSGAMAAGTPDELLMCFAHDVVLGPYLGVPEPQELGFLRWLIDGIRWGLRSPYGAK